MKIRNRAGIFTNAAPALKPEHVVFIKSHLHSYTNAQLLAYVNSVKGSYQYTLPQLRHRLNELHLKRAIQIRWNKHDSRLLQAWYPLLGDVEIALYLNEVGNSKRKGEIKKFTKKHISKKRSIMGWIRTPEQIQRIIADNFLKFPKILKALELGRSPGARKSKEENFIQHTIAKKGTPTRWIKIEGGAMVQIEIGEDAEAVKKVYEQREITKGI